MRKYYVSYVDFAEFRNVTADASQLEAAEKALHDAGYLTDSGKADTHAISEFVGNIAPHFCQKLTRRLHYRPGGAGAVKDTLEKLMAQKEYTAVYLYLTLMYGYIQWKVPEPMILCSGNPQTLKALCTSFLACVQENIPEGEEEGSDDESPDDSE